MICNTNPARPAQADGLECVVCGLDFTSQEAKGTTSVPVGRDAQTGSSVSACAECCGEATSGDYDERNGPPTAANGW